MESAGAPGGVCQRRRSVAAPPNVLVGAVPPIVHQASGKRVRAPATDARERAAGVPSLPGRHGLGTTRAARHGHRSTRATDSAGIRCPSVVRRRSCRTRGHLPKGEAVAAQPASGVASPSPGVETGPGLAAGPVVAPATSRLAAVGPGHARLVAGPTPAALSDQGVRRRLCLTGPLPVAPAFLRGCCSSLAGYGAARCSRAADRPTRGHQRPAPTPQPPQVPPAT